MDKAQDTIAQWVDELCPQLDQQQRQDAIDNVNELIDWLVLTQSQKPSSVEIEE